MYSLMNMNTDQEWFSRGSERYNKSNTYIVHANKQVRGEINALLIYVLRKGAETRENNVHMEK